MKGTAVLLNTALLMAVLEQQKKCYQNRMEFDQESLNNYTTEMSYVVSKSGPV